MVQTLVAGALTGAALTTTVDPSSATIDDSRPTSTGVVVPTISRDGVVSGSPGDHLERLSSRREGALG